MLDSILEDFYAKRSADRGQEKGFRCSERGSLLGLGAVHGGTESDEHVPDRGRGPAGLAGRLPCSEPLGRRRGISVRSTAERGSEPTATDNTRSFGDWVPSRLSAELRRIQGIGLGLGLRKVLWHPGERTDVDAEVVARVVLVYATRFEVAMEALRHEVLHFEIAECRKPFVDLVNAVFSAINEETYRREERLIRQLAGLLEP
jgi:hypothetical protein